MKSSGILVISKSNIDQQYMFAKIFKAHVNYVPVETNWIFLENDKGIEHWSKIFEPSQNRFRS